MDLQHIAELQEHRRKLIEAIGLITQQIHDAITAGERELAALRQSIDDAAAPARRGRGRPRGSKSSAETRARLSENMRRRWAMARANGQSRLQSQEVVTA